MSYGWLTESSLIPEPAVPINVDNSSILAMKIALMKDKQNEQGALSKAKVVKKQEKRINKGIEERMKRDMKDNAAETDQNRLEKLNAILTRKAIIYEQQKQTGIVTKNSLIDFNLKQINDMSEKDQEQYEIERQEFIKKKKEEIHQAQRNLINQRPEIANPQLGFQQNQQELERIQWEQQMMKEIENNIKDSNQILFEKGPIEQSYDKRLSQAEKEKLPNVINEEQEAKEKISEIAKKRKEFQEIRMEKLKKLIKKQ
ncbi:unnamed protein product [Paramecium sonneborni]|uniref:Uncharacterized protein n=1 Tax=Paramecium sonneborni TaxID=65129 RepID=A0A8S1N752_9CILI|nr:unnamed protein product [Paramecium sonneborni]